VEASAWERRKRQTFRDAFADVARDRRWTPGQLEREVQAGLDSWDRMEPELKAMCRRGATLRDVATYIAGESGISVDDLIAEAERTGPIGGGRHR
jgi:hypothetical protein